MSEKQMINVSWEQLQEFMAKSISSALEASSKLNPLEQKKLDEELAKDKRRARLSIELGYAEELKRWNKQRGCSHQRYPQGNKKAGYDCPRGQGEWVTAGQVHSARGNQPPIVTLLCQRCQTQWRFIPSPSELEYFESESLLGFAPPPIDRLLNKDDFMTAPPVRPRELEEVEA